MTIKFPHEITEALKSYVYMYIDPRTSQPFYVGKGQGNRAFDHLSQEAETEKVAKIREIQAAGQEPVIEILRYGLSDSEASLIEASAIDLLGLSQLTNKCRGEHSRSFGRISSAELTVMLTASPAIIRHRALLITINKLYRSSMTRDELYEATRGIWKLSADRESAELAMSVYQGIVREVYRIDRWHPAGTIPYKTRDDSQFKQSGRWEFVGSVAEDLQNEYLNKSVKDYLGKSNQFPVRYVNIKATQEYPEHTI